MDALFDRKGNYPSRSFVIHTGEQTGIDQNWISAILPPRAARPFLCFVMPSKKAVPKSRNGLLIIRYGDGCSKNKNTNAKLHSKSIPAFGFVGSFPFLAFHLIEGIASNGYILCDHERRATLQFYICLCMMIILATVEEGSGHEWIDFAVGIAHKIGHRRSNRKYGIRVISMRGFLKTEIYSHR